MLMSMWVLPSIVLLMVGICLWIKRPMRRCTQSTQPTRPSPLSKIDPWYWKSQRLDQMQRTNRLQRQRLELNHERIKRIKQIKP